MWNYNPLGVPLFPLPSPVPFGIEPWGGGIGHANGLPREYSRNMSARLSDEWAAYQQAMRRARPIIAQWSEWEQQTRNPAWR